MHKQQKQDVHVVNRAGPDVVGKLVYYNWGMETGEKFEQLFKAD